MEEGSRLITFDLPNLLLKITPEILYLLVCLHSSEEVLTHVSIKPF